MDKTLFAVCLLAGIAVPASGASVQSKLIQTATIVSVRKSGPEASHSYGGDNPSDAPLAAEIYVYEVALHAGCDTYVARYASPYDYLPSALARNRQMPVRVESTISLSIWETARCSCRWHAARKTRQRTVSDEAR